MNIKVGSEWFDREFLTPVTVTDDTDEVQVVLRCLNGAMLGIEPDEFLRDYARNEPVTRELLERMGFKQRFVHRGPELFITGRFVISFLDGRLMTYDDEDEAVFLGPPSPTLRDLLNVLRVFGVTAK